MSNSPSSSEYPSTIPFRPDSSASTESRVAPKSTTATSSEAEAEAGRDDSAYDTLPLNARSQVIASGGGTGPRSTRENAPNAALRPYNSDTVPVPHFAAEAVRADAEVSPSVAERPSFPVSTAIDVQSPASPDGFDVAETCEQLLQTADVLRHYMEGPTSAAGLNDARYTVLDALQRYAGQGCSQTQLAGLLLQSESNLSTLLERMRQDGLIARIRSVADRRKCIVQLTEFGEEKLKKARAFRAIAARRLEPSDPVTPTLTQLSSSIRAATPMLVSDFVTESEPSAAAPAASSEPSSNVPPRISVAAPHLLSSPGATRSRPLAVADSLETH